MPRSTRRMAQLLALFAFVLSLTTTGAAHAKAVTRVRWKKVEVRDGDDARRVAKRFEKMLIEKSRKAKWGKGEQLALSARITRLDWEERDEVLRVTVTVVARIKGLRSAKSHIRIGGHPKKRRELEKEALGIVAGGLVTRLSDIARQQAAEEAKRKEAEARAKAEAEEEEDEEDDEDG